MFGLRTWRSVKGEGNKTIQHFSQEIAAFYCCKHGRNAIVPEDCSSVGVNAEIQGWKRLRCLKLSGTHVLYLLKPNGNFRGEKQEDNCNRRLVLYVDSLHLQMISLLSSSPPPPLSDCKVESPERGASRHPSVTGIHV